MAKRIYEYSCGRHITDAYIGEEVLQVKCHICGLPADRIISAPMVKLDPISGDFPTALDKWEKAHSKVIRTPDDEY